MKNQSISAKLSTVFQFSFCSLLKIIFHQGDTDSTEYHRYMYPQSKPGSIIY